MFCEWHIWQPNKWIFHSTKGQVLCAIREAFKIYNVRYTKHHHSNYIVCTYYIVYTYCITLKCKYSNFCGGYRLILTVKRKGETSMFTFYINICFWRLSPTNILFACKNVDRLDGPLLYILATINTKLMLLTNFVI